MSFLVCFYSRRSLIGSPGVLFFSSRFCVFLIGALLSCLFSAPRIMPCDKESLFPPFARLLFPFSRLDIDTSI